MDDHLISDSELDALLTERDPLNTTCLDARQLQSALARLAEDISATSHSTPTRSPIRHPRARRRLVTIAAVAVAVVAAVLVGVGLFGGRTGSLLPNVQLPAAQAAQL